MVVTLKPQSVTMRIIKEMTFITFSNDFCQGPKFSALLSDTPQNQSCKFLWRINPILIQGVVSRHNFGAWFDYHFHKFFAKRTKWLL